MALLEVEKVPVRLQQGEELILEVRRSRITWLRPLFGSLYLATVTFLFFCGFLYLLDTFLAEHKELDPGRWFEDVLHPESFLKGLDLTAIVLMGLVLLVYWVVKIFVTAKIALWLRRRMKKRAERRARSEPEVPDLTSDLPERILRRIAVRNMSRHFRAEKTAAGVLIVLLLAVMLFGLGLGRQFRHPYLGAVFYAFAVLVPLLAYHYICWTRTRYGLTNRRIYTVSGFFSRNIWEIPLGECRHIEGKRNLFQVFGRYGHLTISGINGVAEYLPYVPDPDRFREAIMEALSSLTRGPCETCHVSRPPASTTSCGGRPPDAEGPSGDI